MTPPSAPDAATDRQTVGDILLARGYISEDQLEQAIASQQRSGKPLGQVLVEAGAITRLELAGACGPPARGPASCDSRANGSDRRRRPRDGGSAHGSISTTSSRKGDTPASPSSCSRRSSSSHAESPRSSRHSPISSSVSSQPRRAALKGCSTASRSSRTASPPSRGGSTS